MLDRLLIVWTLMVTLLGLGFIAYQTLRVVHISNEISTLILKTHP